MPWRYASRRRAGVRSGLAARRPFGSSRAASSGGKGVRGPSQGITRGFCHGTRLKVASSVTNARAFVELQGQCGSFDRYVWSFVGGKPITNRWRSLRQVPASTPESDALSRDLKRRGFRFVGSTIMYAFMQATGLVNDHLVACPRWKDVQKTQR